MFPVFFNIFFLLEKARIWLLKLLKTRWGALLQLQPDYIRTRFNPHIIDHPQVKYFSYAGKINLRLTLGSLLRYPFYHWMAKDGDNDTMVTVDSSKWGEFKGILPADHGEMIGLTLNPWHKSGFNVIQFVIEHLHEIQQFDES